MSRTVVPLVLACVMSLLGFGVAVPVVPAQAQTCPTEVSVPGAEFVQVTCLEDLTTLSNPRMDQTTYGWGGSGNRSNPSLNSTLTTYTDTAVPGLQIEGWFPDSCSRYEIEHNTFIPACPDGHRHNGQFVIRIPDDWDGEHLVVAGAPGIRTQFANDIILSDFVLARGWAYAAHDKGNTGLNFFRTGDDETAGELLTWDPPEAIAQWPRFSALTAVAAQGALEQVHGRQAERTYAAGISNGGYLVRLALERYPELFDAGVDWEGTLFSEESSVLTWIPPLLRGFPSYRASGDQAGYEEMVHGGLVPPDSEPIWDDHYVIYWGAVASTYRPALDPEYSSYVDAPRLVVPPADADAQYDYTSRPQFVHDRVAELANTGDINGRPLITLHGTLDALLPIAADSDRYADMVRAAGHDQDYRYYVVEGGTHVDGAADDFPDTFRPILPCFLGALDAVDAWVSSGVAPPPSGLIPFPQDATPTERANTCGLPQRVDRVAGADRVSTAIQASQQTFGVSQTVVIATAGDFPDALAATPLAASLDAPLLLVDGGLTDGLREELHRTGALEAMVVGGPAAVSDEVVQALQVLGLEVTRLDGPDRYATAVAIAERMIEEAGPAGGPGTTSGRVAFVASGEGFADALSAGPVAAAVGAPILLTAPAGLPAVTAAALQRLGVTRTVVAGGSAAISDGVLADLPSPIRVAGSDRFATSIALAEYGLAHGLRADEVYLATASGFADALAAGTTAAVGEWGAAPRGPLLLVDGSGGPAGQATLDWLSARAGEVERALLFGGTAAISPQTETQVRAALG
ncbi:MAG: cell wall-binding repeat-containing protein [Euzebya sp.]